MSILRGFRSRISVKVTAAVVAITLAAFALLTWSLQRGANAALLSSNADALASRRASRGANVQRYFVQQRGAVRAVARSVLARNAMSRMPGVVHAGLPASADVSTRPDYAVLRASLQRPASDLLASFGWEDLLLVDTTGTVVYSVTNDIPVGARPRPGDTTTDAIARAFSLALTAHTDTVRFVDFAPYAPNGDSSAAFLSAVIPADSSHMPLGVLVVRIARRDLNSITIERTGLGNSGEIYLVGSDSLLRTDARFLDKDESSQRRIASDAVSIGLMGGTGVEIQNDYRGVRVLTAFGPLDVGDARWAVVAEVDYGEVVAPAQALGVRALWILLGMSIGGGLLLVVTLRAVVLRPILALADAAYAVESGSLETTVPVSSTDEFGQLGRAFNNMVHAVSTQVRELRSAHESIARKEEEFRALVGNVSGAVYRCLPFSPWRMLFLSEEMRTLTGYDAAEFLGEGARTLGDIIHPEDRARVMCEAEQAIAADRQYVLQYRVIDREGRVRHLLDQGRATYDADGRPIDLFGTLYDETQRRLAEDAIGAERRKLEEILNTTPVGVAIIVDGRGIL